jgi:hypothetical protein
MTQQEYDAMMKQYALEQQLREQYSASPYNPTQFAGKTGSAQNSSLNNLLGNVGYNPADLFGGNYGPAGTMPVQADYVDPGNLTQETYGYSTAYKPMFDAIASGVDPKSAAKQFFVDNPNQYTDAADPAATQKDVADMIKLGESFAADKFKQDKSKAEYDSAGRKAQADWAAKNPKNMIQDQMSVYDRQVQDYGGQSFDAKKLAGEYAHAAYRAPIKAPVKIGSVQIPASQGTGGVFSSTQLFEDPAMNNLVNQILQTKIDKAKQTTSRGAENLDFMNKFTAAYGNPYK